MSKKKDSTGGRPERPSVNPDTQDKMRGREKRKPPRFNVEGKKELERVPDRMIEMTREQIRQMDAESGEGDLQDFREEEEQEVRPVVLSRRSGGSRGSIIKKVLYPSTGRMNKIAAGVLGTGIVDLAASVASTLIETNLSAALRGNALLGVGLAALYVGEYALYRLRGVKISDLMEVCPVYEKRNDGGAPEILGRIRLLGTPALRTLRGKDVRVQRREIMVNVKESLIALQAKIANGDKQVKDIPLFYGQTDMFLPSEIAELGFSVAPVSRHRLERPLQYVERKLVQYLVNGLSGLRTPAKIRQEYRITFTPQQLAEAVARMTDTT